MRMPPPTSKSLKFKDYEQQTGQPLTRVNTSIKEQGHYSSCHPQKQQIYIIVMVLRSYTVC